MAISFFSDSKSPQLPLPQPLHPSYMKDPVDELVEALTQVWKTNPNKINWNVRRT